MVFLSLLFWALLASYVVHILDETLLNGGFVQWIVDNFWPGYTMRMFFWFNAGAIAAIAISNLLFDSLVAIGSSCHSSFWLDSSPMC